MADKGKLIVYFGCMYSGKTSSLIRYIQDKNLKENEYLLLKPEIDVRYSKDEVVSHDGMKLPGIVCGNEFELFPLLNPYTRLVAIDEAQFFNKAFISEIRRVLNKGIDVVAGGLDKDYLNRPFGLMATLIQDADEKNQLFAKCEQCGADAEFSYRKSDNKVLVLIGHKEYYEARCSNCIPSDN